MGVVKAVIASVVPALIVAGRFLLFREEGDIHGYAAVFAILGFSATLAGCVIAVVVLRRRLIRIPVFVVTAIAVAVAGVLLAIYPTMPSWPFTGEGFVVAWVLIAAGVTAALMYGAGWRYA